MIGGFSIVGRLAMGNTTERIGWNWPMAISCFGGAIAVLSLLIIRNIEPIYAFAIVYGFFYGGIIPFFPGLAGYLFGTKSLAQIIGIAHGLGLGLGSIGPLVAGFIFDITGSYAIAFIITALNFGIAGILAIVIRPPHH